MKKLLLVLSMALFSVSVMLGQRTVTGKVTDQSNEPLVGASVLVKGTTSGTVTEIDGTYSVRVPEGGTVIVFSYTGFETVEITLGASNVVDVAMAEGVTLETAVVTALGIERDEKSLGYATQEVMGDEVSRVKDFNFINSLSGKVAGVNIRRSNNLGGSANVVIRGYKSLTGNNQALFVVDGTIINNDITNSANQRTGRGGFDYGNAAMDINPEDIESISILKGAAASALYGARAANGVILITTKKGSKAKGLGVTASYGLTMGQIDKSTFVRYQDEYGPGYSAIQGWYAEGGLDFFDFGNGPVYITPTYEDASFGQKFDPNLMVADWRSLYRDWDKYEYGQLFPFQAAENDASTFYETSMVHNANVSIDGKTDRSNFRLGYTYYDNSGILPNSNINRNTISFAGGYKLNDKLTASATINYVLTNGLGRYGTGYDNRNVNQSFRQWYQVTTDIAEQREAYEATGLNISWNPYGALDPDRATVPHYFDNYYFNRFENFQTDERGRTFGNVQLEYKATDWLNFTGRVSTDRYSELQEERIAAGSVDVPSYSRFNRTFFENNFDLFANVNKDLTPTLNLGAMLGTNIRRSQLESIYAATNGGLVVPGVYSLSNSINGILAPSENLTRIGVNGYFGQLSLGYDNFLYLDLTGRYDISSTLPEGNNSYFYPSASLSFVFSELLNVSALDFGKFRVNYAQVGNDAPAKSILDTYVLGTPYNGIPLASFPSTKNNPDLLPESTESIELGLDMRFLKNRLGLDLSVYQSDTYDQIMPVTVTGATGNLFQYVNAGQIRNRGIEVMLNLGLVRTKDFRWDMNINWSKNESEVIELFGDQTNLQLYSAQGGITVNASVGQPFGTLKGTNYVYHTDGSPIVYPNPFGGVRYRKSATPEVIGDINPDWIGGVMNTFTYKGLSLGFLIDFRKGGDFFSLDTWYGYATGIYDITAGLNDNGVPVRDLPADGGGIFIDGAVVQTGTDENGKPISDGTPNTEAFYASDVYSSLGYVYAPNAYHIYDGSFIKLRELNLTYSLPASLLKNSPIKGVDVSLIGRNLWIIHKNSPYSDPEDGLSAGNFQGNQSGAYPAVKELGFNVRLRF
jgi:TonB-linked SusC/RagA family outer membrane protein